MARAKKTEPSIEAFNPSSYFPAPTLPDVSKAPKVRQSGHYVDQKLKYTYPEQRQMTIFEILDPDVIGKVEKYDVRYEGIRLTPPEERLLNGIYKLLRDKSETKDIKSPTFYKGNYDGGQITEWGGEAHKRALISLKPTEMYMAYLGRDDYSGKEIMEVNKTLEGLAGKRFLMIYDRVRSVQVNKGKTETRTDRIEKYAPLIELVKYTRDLTDEELKRLDKGDGRIRQAKGEIILALNPILTDQIQTKYVEYPEDINRRMIIAVGGDAKRVTQAMHILSAWCAREISNKRYKSEINADKLPYVLKLDKYIQESRRKLIQTTIENAVQACKNLGLILDVSLEAGKAGQLKYVFTLNKDY